VKVPKTLPLPMLAPLGCGIQTGAGTILNSLAVPAGRSVAVFGTGTVGLAAVMAARIAGAQPIIGIDVVPKRLAMARELGATHVIDGRREDVASGIRGISGKGVDFTVETTGDDRMLECSLELLSPRGVAALVTGASAPGRLPGGRKAMEIVMGDAVPQSFIPRMIALHRRGLFPLDRLMAYYPLQRINRAIADALRGTAIKPVVCMNGASDPRQAGGRTCPGASTTT